MSKLETSGNRRWWPMRELQGSDQVRGKITKECFVDITTGQTHHPISGDGESLGWNGAPPNAPTGSKDREGVEVDHDAYRRGWELVFGGKADGAC